METDLLANTAFPAGHWSKIWSNKVLCSRVRTTASRWPEAHDRRPRWKVPTVRL